MKQFKGSTAVITGAGSGFGLETRAHRRAARHERRAGRRAAGRARPRRRRDRGARRAGAARNGSTSPRPPRSRRSARRRRQRFGAPHFVFNNAGVGAGGLIWENTLADWDWVLGVNLMGVVHGVRVFTPMMLEAAAQGPGVRRPHRQHRVDGRPAQPAEHGRLQRQQARGRGADRDALPGPAPRHRPDRRLGAVPVLRADRHRRERAQPARATLPAGQADAQPADRQGDERQGRRQRQGQRRRCRAASSSTRSARTASTSTAIPKALGSVQTRLEDVVQARNPTDPFAGKPEIGAELRAALARAAGARRPPRCGERPG